jgi:MFS family permease
MINVNLNQMCESVDRDVTAAAAVSIFAAGNGLGRLVVGPVSDLAHKRSSLPRPTWLCLCSLIMGLGHTALAIRVGPFGFYLSVFGIGSAFGAMFTLNVVIVSELWGSATFGSNYMFFDGTTSVVGTLVVAKYLTQMVYSDHIELPETTVCHGHSCFAETHWVIAGTCCAALVSQAALAWQTRGLYMRTQADDKADPTSM